MKRLCSPFGNKEYCLKLGKSLSEIIKAAINAQGEVTQC